MKLGTFTQDNFGGIHGKIRGLGIGVTPVMFEPQTSRDGKPYLKVIADPVGEAYEVGAAFEKEKDGLKYYSVSLESPAFAAPLNAALFPDREDPTLFNLVWDRPEQQKPKAEANAEAGQSRSRRFAGASAAP